MSSTSDPVRLLSESVFLKELNICRKNVEKYAKDVQYFYEKELGVKEKGANKSKQGPTSADIQTIYADYNSTMATLRYALIRTTSEQINPDSRKKYGPHVQNIFSLSLLCAHVLGNVLNVGSRYGIVDAELSRIVKYKLEASDVCEQQTIYVENKMLDALSELCNTVAGGERKGEFCSTLHEFRAIKLAMDTAFSNRTVTHKLIYDYRNMWQKFCRLLIDLFYDNFIELFGSRLVQCMSKFVDQQIQICVQLLEMDFRMQLAREKNTPTALAW